MRRALIWLNLSILESFYTGQYKRTLVYLGCTDFASEVQSKRTLAASKLKQTAGFWPSLDFGEHKLNQTAEAVQCKRSLQWRWAQVNFTKEHPDWTRPVCSTLRVQTGTCKNVQEIEISKWLFGLPVRQDSQSGQSGSNCLLYLGLPSKSHN